MQLEGRQLIGFGEGEVSLSHGSEKLGCQGCLQGGDGSQLTPSHLREEVRGGHTWQGVRRLQESLK